MHSHGPGQPPHSHGPPQAQQAQMVMRPPDPVMQALIEATFQPVDIKLGPPDNASALCGAHSLEKCAECNVDYVALNRMSKLLQANPALRCPPPPNIVTTKLSQVINTTKDEGNVRLNEIRVHGMVEAELYCWNRHCSKVVSMTRPSSDTPWLLA